MKGRRGSCIPASMGNHSRFKTGLSALTTDRSESARAATLRGSVLSKRCAIWDQLLHLRAASEVSWAMRSKSQIRPPQSPATSIVGGKSASDGG